MICKWCKKPIERRNSWGIEMYAHQREGQYVSQCITFAEPEILEYITPSGETVQYEQLRLF